MINCLFWESLSLMYVYKQLNSGNIHLIHHQEPKNICMIYPPKKFKKISWINIKFTCADAIQIYHLPFYIKSWIHHRYGDIPVTFMKTVTSFESKVKKFYPRPWVKEIQHCWNMGPSSVWRGDNFKLLKNLFALKSRLFVQER